MVAITSSDVWAVGVGYGFNPDITLIEHWDGTSWQIITSPNPGTASNQLLGVAATSSTDVWVVGAYSNTGTVQQTLIEHWNGTKWKAVNSPSLGLANNLLSSVVALSTTAAWAVGSYENQINLNKTLIEHYS